MNLNISIKSAAIITGVSLLLMTILAGLTMGVVFNSLFTADQVQFKSELEKVKPFFMAGTLGWVLIFVLDVIVSIGLYIYFRKEKSKKALVMASLRCVYSIILGLAIVKLFTAAFFMNEIESKSNEILVLINSFQGIWHFGLIIFGFHLIALAPLVCKKRSIQFMISVLLLLAGLGYLISNVSDLFVSDYELYRTKVEMIFIVPMIFGELGLALWLLIKGGK